MANQEVYERSDDSLELVEQTDLLRTLMKGTRGMRAASTKYLPKAQSELNAVYNRRLAMSHLYNGYRFAVTNLSGRPFSNPIKLTEATPGVIWDWAKNIDNNGTSLHEFTKNWFMDLMIAGRSHILVDKPAGTPKNRSEELANRPYLQIIRAEDVLGWKSENISGEQVFTQFRVRETGRRDDPDNKWGTIYTRRVRIFYLDGWELWEENPEKEDDWNIIDGGDSNWERIPIVTGYAIENGFMDSEPPLEDLAWVNLAHWQSQSDQRNILHITRVPILFGAGFPDLAGGNNIEIASNRAIFARDPSAKLGYVEHSSQAIGSGRQDLKDLEAQMDALSMVPLVPGMGNTSPTSAAIQSADNQSMLQSMTLNLMGGINRALNMMLEWQDLPGEAEAIVTTEYGLALREGEHVGALLQLRLSGDISRRTLWEELRRRDVLSDQFDPEEEEAEIQDEAPALMAAMAPMTESGEEELADEVLRDDADSELGQDGGDEGL